MGIHPSAWSSYESPFGKLALTASNRGLDGLFFPGRAPRLIEMDAHPELFEAAIGQLDQYFAGTLRRFDLPLDLSGGTQFQQAVWHQLQAIPYGTTITYGDLAKRIGRPDRVRAAAAAIGRNPLPIIIPCHRVIGADGGLTGYIGGLHRKQALLDTENAVVQGNGSPTEFGTRQLALL
jgi:methylated-DNA-[protein]-cysteine S-methyltransferase